jgi:hypothetical protein
MVVVADLGITQVELVVMRSVLVPEAAVVVVMEMDKVILDSQVVLVVV